LAIELGTDLTHALACASDGVAFMVEQLVDDAQQLDVRASIHAVRAARLQRLDAAELALPVAKHVRLDPDNLGGFTYLEELPVG
jgi:hypothetical protein